MNYTAEHIDAEKFEKSLDDYRRVQEQKLFSEQLRVQAFYEGYSAAIHDAQGMLHCSNYENEDKRTAAFMEGVNSAIYEICKELDIGSQDIRDMVTSLDEKAALIAQRIRDAFQQGDNPPQ